MIKIATDAEHKILQVAEEITVEYAHLYELEENPFDGWLLERIMEHCFLIYSTVNDEGETVVAQSIYPHVIQDETPSGGQEINLEEIFPPSEEETEEPEKNEE